MTEGLYRAKPALPFVPGMEAAGEVVAAGEGSRWKAGDRVIVATMTGAAVQYGAFADAALLPLPDTMTYAEGASLRAAYITAWTAIARLGRAEAGETLVVHGAAGGVGLAAVDLGKALGLKVIAAASSPEKREAIARLYAPDHVLAGPVGLREVDSGANRCGAGLIWSMIPWAAMCLTKPAATPRSVAACWSSALPAGALPRCAPISR